jgi:integrase
VIRRSTKQGNKRIAEQLESAHKTRLLKGEVGIIEPGRTPTVKEFAPRFLAHVETANADKPATVAFYRHRLADLLESELISNLPMDSITGEHISTFAKKHRARGYEVSTVNRSLATLRKMVRLLADWENVAVRKVKLLPGENRRDRVLTEEEEAAYLSAAETLLRNVAIMMLDSGCRPEEVHQLTWPQYADGFLWIWKGKQTGSRRRVEATQRVKDTLATIQRDGLYVFPAPTKTGHISPDSYKDMHAAAITESKVVRFVPYTLRHTAITRMAVLGLDPPALMY